uniref:SHSP domain-containing protein n=1 Tax=Aegilops tauschii subsp. strangulata TaxID=200361 RepID=A0A452ZGF7_AEGTS
PYYITRAPSSRPPQSPALPAFDPHQPASADAAASDRGPGRRRRAQVVHVAAGEHLHGVPQVPRRRRRRQGRVRGGLPVQPLPVRQVLRPGRRVPHVGVRVGRAARRAPPRRPDHRRLGRERLRVPPQSRHTRWKEVRGGGERRRRKGGGRERAVAGAAGGRPGLARRPVGWEHGFVRRVELPEDADGGRVEAYFDDGAGSLEIKVPKRSSDAHQQA